MEHEQISKRTLATLIVPLRLKAVDNPSRIAYPKSKLF